MTDYVDRIKPDSYGITTYLENLLRGQYQIPTFQREVVWDRSQVKRLWDSVYKFFPLGSILVWLTGTELQNHREIGGHILKPNPDVSEFQYLLDGQQRTTALLTSIYGGQIKGQEDDDLRVFVDLTLEDNHEVEDETWRSRFLFWREIDDRNGELPRNTPRQKKYSLGLIVSLQDISKRYDEIEERLDGQGIGYRDTERKQLRRFRQVLDNYKISFIELRGIEVAEVCQIFERVNQAGQPLSMFDIVVAKTYRPDEPGKAGFYLRGMFDDFRKQLDQAGSRYAQIDDMTLLQMMAVLVRDAKPDAGIQNITDTYLNALRTEYLEAIWDDAIAATRRVFDFLENHIRLPGPALVPFRYFYMSLASYFFRNQDPDYGLLGKYFWFFSFHNDDLLSNTTHLREHVSKFQNCRQGGEFDFGRFYVDRDRLRRTTYSSRGRWSRALLALLAHQDPFDWEHPQKSVLHSVYFSLTDNPNLHHIFPKAFCEKHLPGSDDLVDSLLNIAYLTQLTNLRIGEKNPLEYMRDFMSDDFKAQLHRHLLPDAVKSWVRAESMADDALRSFVEARLDLVLNQLRSYLGGIKVEVVDTRAQMSDGGQDSEFPAL